MGFSQPYLISITVNVHDLEYGESDTFKTLFVECSERLNQPCVPSMACVKICHPSSPDTILAVRLAYVQFTSIHVSQQVDAFYDTQCSFPRIKLLPNNGAKSNSVKHYVLISREFTKRLTCSPLFIQNAVSNVRRSLKADITTLLLHIVCPKQ